MALFKITEVSEYAFSKVSEYEEGRVHSVYNRTVNLELGGELLSLLGEGSPRGPGGMFCNLREEELRKKKFFTGQSFTIREGELRFGNVTADFHGAAIYQTRLRAFSSETKPAEVRLKAERAIKESEVGGFAALFQKNGGFGPVEEMAKKCIMRAANCYKRGEERKSAMEFARLVGLGIGLTPSGDDFLCGIFASLILLNKEKTEFFRFFREEVKTNLDRTGDIGASFLKQAGQGHFAEAVLKLGEYGKASEIKEEFLRIGHSSGMDCLTGICYGFCIFAANFPHF